MRRLIIGALTAVLLVSMNTGQAQATGVGPCSDRSYNVTHRMGPLRREAHVKALIRCVFDYFAIGSQIVHAYYVVNRESRFTPWAKNPWLASACRPWSSSAYGSCGLAQHLARYWPGRVQAYLPRRYFPFTWPHVPILQPRANVWAMAAMVKTSGWSAWGG
jgi:hypothetical protein